MIFMCGGHGVCLTKSDSASAAFGDSEHAQEARLAWFDRYLRGRAKTDTGPAFEWIDEDGDLPHQRALPAQAGRQPDRHRVGDAAADARDQPAAGIRAAAVRDAAAARLGQGADRERRRARRSSARRSSR